MTGPYSVKIELIIISEDLETEGTVSIEMGKANVPSRQEVEETISNLDLPPDFRLMTKQEFWHKICSEKIEGDVDDYPACPGAYEWDSVQKSEKEQSIRTAIILWTVGGVEYYLIDGDYSHLDGVKRMHPSVDEPLVKELLRLLYHKYTGDPLYKSVKLADIRAALLDPNTKLIECVNKRY